MSTGYERRHRTCRTCDDRAPEGSTAVFATDEVR